MKFHVSKNHRIFALFEYTYTFADLNICVIYFCRWWFISDLYNLSAATKISRYQYDYNFI